MQKFNINNFIVGNRFIELDLTKNIFARELDLFLENDYECYQFQQAIEKNLHKHIAKGVYDSKQAFKSFKRLTDYAMRSYYEQFGDRFSVYDRSIVAVYLGYWFEYENLKDKD